MDPSSDAAASPKKLYHPLFSLVLSQVDDDESAQVFLPLPGKPLESRDRCYDLKKNIFAEKISEKIGIFDSKQS
jgi:hypothetical protein